MTDQSFILLVACKIYDINFPDFWKLDLSSEYREK